MKQCAKMPKNIVLIGYMGSGKSRIGRELTSGSFSGLGLRLLDTDEYIEKKMSCTIPEIFEKEGEPFFREKETETLRELSSEEGLLLSTGGGMPVKEENRPLLKSIGPVVYLRAEVSTIVKRVYGGQGRPLLEGAESLEEKVKSMLKVRGPIYEEVADIIVDVDNRTPEDIAKEIINILKMNEK